MTIKSTLFSGLTLLGLAIISLTANAQEKPSDSNHFERAPFHFAFATPLSTNGLKSYETVNHSSFNLFYGHSAGLEGVEIGTFLNIDNEFVRGFQASGFVNFSMGELKGFQGSGFGNFAKGSSKGVQLAGLANANSGNFAGFQGAGFLNVAGGNMKGAQVSGFLNVADHMDGVQVGFLNVADSFEGGVPIGFLSIVKNGYNHIEAWGSEAFQANLSAKLGVASFYNIFSVGKQIGGSQDLWGIGYGIGTYLPIKDRWGVNADLMAYDINKNDELLDETNLLNTLKLNANYQVGNFEIFAGPTVNLLITEENDGNADGTRALRNDIGPDAMRESTNNGNHFKSWIGANVGIRY